MKIALFIVAVVFAGCAEHAAGDPEGVYTRESAGEYSRAWDTLKVYEYNTDGGIFLIERRTGFIRIKEGIPLPRKWREEKMMGIYDAQSGQLVDKKTGRLFTFKDGELLFGTATYKKIK